MYISNLPGGDNLWTQDNNHYGQYTHNDFKTLRHALQQRHNRSKGSCDAAHYVGNCPLSTHNTFDFIYAST